MWSQGTRAAAIVIWPMIALMALGCVGCGGGDSGAVSVSLERPVEPVEPEALQQLPDDEADPSQPPQELPPALVVVGDSLPAFPGGDAEGPLSAWRATSEEGQRVVDGNQRVAEAGSGNYPAQESDGYVIVPGGDDELSAWIQFSVPEFDDERPVDIFVVVDSAPLVPGGDEELPLSYWVGVGNFTHYTWDWYGPYDGDEGFELNSAELKDRFVSEDGVHYLVVLTLAGEQFAGEGNPEGLTAAKVEFTRIDTLTVDDAEYFHTNPHYVWIDALELRDGYKGASALDPDTQYVTIEWTHHRDFVDANSEASLYQVQRQLVGEPGALPELLNTVGAPGRLFVDPTDSNVLTEPVVPGRTYQYYIRAQNPLDGFTPWSLARTVTIPLLAPPDLAASDGNPADQLVLTWTKSEGATGYRIFRDGQEPEDLIVTVGDVDTYTDTDIKDIEVHTYWIRARNDYALSDFSEPDTGFLLLTLPEARLTGDPLDGEFPLEVHFDASASHDPDNGEEPGEGIVQYEFQFDTDGSWVDNGDDPWTTHVYEEEATYRARVRVTDNDGQVDTSDVVPINDNDPPVAELDAAPLKGEPPLEVTFDASGSHDDDGTIVRYDWDFDNDDVIDDTTEEATNTHPYETSGKYTARVDVVDDDGDKGVAYSGEIKVNLHPSAVLAADPVSGTVPLTVQFDASDSTDADGSVTKYEYDFDDGNGWEDKGLNDSPEHKYDEPGEYDVKLRVTDDYEDTDTDETVRITVGDAAICYAAEVDSQWGIYIMDSDGSRQTWVCDISNQPYRVMWSPDKSMIAFDDSSSWAIWLVNSDGTGKGQVPNTGGYSYPNWVDNEYLIMSHAGGSNLYRIKTDGTDLVKLPSRSCAIDSWLSPDGKRLAYSLGTADYNYKLVTADYPEFRVVKTLVDISLMSDLGACWGRNGQVVWSPYDAGAREVYKIDDAGIGPPTQLDPPETTGEKCARLSGDGASVVFSGESSSAWDIWVMDSAGTTATALTSNGNSTCVDWYVKRWPKAILEADPASGPFPLTVDLDASASYDMDNGTGDGLGIKKYEWDWDGDGTWDYDSGTTSTIQHTYNTPGVYETAVRVTDDEDDQNTATVMIGASWVHTWGGAENENLYGLAATSAGDLYAAGGSASFTASAGDALILKYDLAGDLQFARTWGGSNLDRGYDIAMLGTDALVVGYTGSYGEGSIDGLLLKYSSSGSLGWEKTWGGEDSDYFEDLALDSSDNVYLVGNTTSYGAGGEDACVLKLNSAGIMQWERAWGGGSAEHSMAIALHGDSAVYVAANSSAYGAGNYDFVLLKYNSSGTLQWQKTWGGGSEDSPWGIAVDDDENIYVAGYTWSFGAGNMDIAIVQFASDGSVNWDRVWGGSGSDIAHSVAIDGYGYAVVTGYTGSDGHGAHDLVELRIDSDGYLLAERGWGDTSHNRGYPVALGADGRLYFGGLTPNASGAWEDVTGSWQPASGTTGNATGTSQSISGTYQNVTGTTGSPVGTEDSGGGGDDALIIKLAE